MGVVRAGLFDAALRGAQASIEYGEQADNLQPRFGGLVLRALAHDARGDKAEAARSCGEALARWHAVGGKASMARTLAYLAALEGHEPDVGRAASPLHPNVRWKPALMLMAEGSYVDAADAFAHIGSKPLEAAAWLRAATAADEHGATAEARVYAQHALRFFESVGADVYAARALRLTRAAVQ